MNAQRTGDQRTGTETSERGPGGMFVHESGTPGSPAIVFIHGAGRHTDGTETATLKEV